MQKCQWRNSLRIGIYSDIHSNLEALNAVLEALREENVGKTFCLGDLVGYGPDPNSCIEQVMHHADEILLGNHDQAAIGLLNVDDFNENAAMAIEWTRGVLTVASTEFLNRLPLMVIDGSVSAVHATPEAPEEWHYLLGTADVGRNLAKQETPVCFIGHSHVPTAYVQDAAGRIRVGTAADVRFEAGMKYLINVGSVGQPRDGDPRAAYGVLDTAAGHFRLKRVAYPIQQVQKKMHGAGLPRFLIERLAVGK